MDEARCVKVKGSEVAFERDYRRIVESDNRDNFWDRNIMFLQK